MNRFADILRNAVRMIVVFAGIFLFFGSERLAVAQDDEKVIRVDTKLAEFEVFVEDKDGKPVRGLSERDFRIFENGKERKIDFFQPVVTQGTARPLVIVFAVDVSGSMTPPEIEKLRTAINGFIERFGNYEAYFAVVSFAMDVKRTQSFTNRPD
ncbi:MAG: VWA domain-containing protein, partial [Pyrinomonadaceae bacterium]